MRLERLPGPFDDPSSGARPATPTCGGCCCCCCCLVTTFTSATLTAVHVNHLATVSERSTGPRIAVTTGAALTMPLVVALAIGLVWTTETVMPALVAVAVHAAVLAGLYRTAGADGSTVTGAALGIPLLSAVCFVGEAVSLGLAVYGQALALVIPPVAGVALARRLRARRP